MEPLQLRPRRAFTLIELLVVISIIALLAAILFPVFGRVREGGRRSSCQSNLKQFGVAIQMYLQDFDDKYPMSLSFTTPGLPPFKTAFDALLPYAKNSQIALCPSNADKPDVDLTPYGASAPYSYTGNDQLFTYPDLGIPVISAAVVQQSSQVPMVYDASNGETVGGVPDPTTWQLNATNYPPVVLAAKRHLGGGNCLYVDGHVKWHTDRPAFSDGAYPNFYWNADPTQ